MSKTPFISIFSPVNYSEIIYELICAIDLFPSVWTEPGKHVGCVTVYFDSKKEAEKAKPAIHLLLKNSNDLIPQNAYELISGEMDENEWTTVWKKYFHAKRVGKTIVIKPPWEDYQTQENDVIIEIDPEMSFGTGLHPTTRACLEFIEDIAAEMKGGTFLDIGTGSGVLSIAASKMGFGEIDAFDNSQESLIAAGKNCRLNNVEINLFEAELGNFIFEKNFNQNSATIHNAPVTRLERRRRVVTRRAFCNTVKGVSGIVAGFGYDVVVANIIVSILLPNIDSIISALKPDGILILSGILEHQYPEILKEVSGRGLKEIKSRIIDGWKSGMFLLFLHSKNSGRFRKRNRLYTSINC